MKICLIGNSHIACIKKAWDSINLNNKLITITFFGSHAGTLINTEANQNKLIPTNEQVKNSFNTTSDGQTFIDFSQFDICIIHGILPSFKGWQNLLDKFKSNIFYTQSLINSYVESDNVLAKHLINGIRTCSSIPIIVTPRANPSIKKAGGITDTSVDDLNKINDFIESGLTLLGIRDLNIHYIPQPEKTIINSHYTHEKYNKNGFGLRNVAPPDDFTHMNAAYGEEYLKQLFPYLKSLNNKTLTNSNFLMCETNEL